MVIQHEDGLESLYGHLSRSLVKVGQTVAAHDLCRSIYANRKHHHLQAGVGHYGVFSGRKWATQIYPLVRNMILAAS